MSMPLNRLVGYVFGAVYLLVGLLGFFVHSGGFASTDGSLLLGIFEVNHLHSIVHLLIGVALVGAASKSLPAARGVNTTIGAVYLLLGVLGPFLVGTALNIVALNAADHVLHLASGAVLLGVGLFADKRLTSRAV